MSWSALGGFLKIGQCRDPTWNSIHLKRVTVVVVLEKNVEHHTQNAAYELILNELHIET